MIKEWYQNMVTFNEITYDYLTDFEGYDNNVTIRFAVNIVSQIVFYWLGRGTYRLMYELAHAEVVTNFGGDSVTSYVGDDAYKVWESSI